MKIKVSNLIAGILVLILGICFLVWGHSYSSQFGPQSDICRNLTELGYFETRYEYVGHDSCIDGEYEWKEDCKMILPFLEPLKCMYDYNHDDFNDTCNKDRRNQSLEIYKEYQTFGVRCVTHPFNKVIWLFPIIISIGIIGIALAVIYSSIFNKEKDTKTL